MKVFKKLKFDEVENWEVKDFKKSETEEFEVWRSQSLKKSKIEVLRLNPSLQLELSLGDYWHRNALRVPAD
jgi:hypothetical protein